MTRRQTLAEPYFSHVLNHLGSNDKELIARFDARFKDLQVLVSLPLLPESRRVLNVDIHPEFDNVEGIENRSRAWRTFLLDWVQQPQILSPRAFQMGYTGNTWTVR